MIAVVPGAERSGRGTALLSAVERELTRDGQRMLLVETSGTAAYLSARRFYERSGYDRVAEVADYFEPGDDLVLSRKVLGA